ncbi:MAG: hypothetical protein QOE70_1267 [Chthoniobacter sp.]|jgi:two-component system CheB/CheR fusion protein|nr:hypothetical protein [Chthoniobacter sp.]
MNYPEATAPIVSAPSVEKALTFALRLAHAEHALQTLTSGQVDAIVDPRGNTYLLRPAQERLRRNEARLQALFDSVPDVITVLNEAGEVRYQSPAVTRVLGYAVGTLYGRSVFEFVHPDDLPGFERAFSEAMQKVRPITTADFRHRARDGSWCPLEATLGSVPQSIEPAGVILTFRDTTHRRLVQEETARREAVAGQASLAKDRFLAMLSHELRTPLTPALLGVQTLEEDERFAEARPTLAMIHRNLELQSRLLGELLDFITVGQQKVRLQSGSIDAHEAVRFVLEICRSEIAAAQIEVLLDFRSAESLVRADPMRLQQVMWNLLKNAIKFSAPGSSISIATLDDPPGRLTIEFADHGVGIEPALLPLVFDSFQQGGLSGPQVNPGLGLGLFIARGLAEAQGGTLTALSEGRGKGSLFRLTLPKAPPGGAMSTEALPGPLPDRRLQILLVEDHAVTRIVHGRLLEQLGHEVSAAADLRGGLLLAEICRFDLVICDLILSDGTGHQLMEGLRRSHPALPGVALSAFGLPADLEESRAAGFSEHLVKPIAFESLQSAIHKLAAKERPAPGATT